MKNTALAVLAILFVLIICGGCATGVSESQYYATKAELQSVKAEISVLKAQSKLDPQVKSYAEINDMLMDGMRVAYGEPSKYGYSKGDTQKWLTDVAKKVMAQGDMSMAILIESYGASIANGTVKEQFQRGTALMSYVSQKLVTLTAK